MNFDDTETKSFENKYAEFAEWWDNLGDDKKQELINAVKSYARGLQELVKQETLTPDEVAKLKKHFSSHKEVDEKLQDFLLLLNEKNFRAARVVHEHIKRMAAEGNAAAIKAAEELDESYRATLNSEIERN